MTKRELAIQRMRDIQDEMRRAREAAETHKAKTEIETDINPQEEPSRDRTTHRV